MFSLTKPSNDSLSQFLLDLRDARFTYPEVEGTRTTFGGEGYSVNRQRCRLGSGRTTFLSAQQCLRSWKMFPAEFVEVIWPTPIEAGRVVATLFQAPGFWTLNPCRIVYTFDEADPAASDIERFGFAYGTVGCHLAAGEERFTVEYHQDDESVWYEVYCFSKARHWLAKVAYPYLRLQQYRFRQLSAHAMRESVREIGGCAGRGDS